MAQILVDMHKAKQLQLNETEDSDDSDFNPRDVRMNDYSNTNSITPIVPISESHSPSNSNSNPNPPVVQRRHRYQTRSTTVITEENSNALETKEEEEQNEADSAKNEKKRRKRKRKPRKGAKLGRPPKCPKKRSNHIDISTKGMSKEEEQKLRERLAKMDEYDTQQYIESVVEQIHSGEYVHPFISKETAIPRRRINKIIKLDPNMFKIASQTTEMMAILIEIFVRDLVSRSYKYTLEDNRKSLKMQDLCRAVQADHMYDFLIDVVPRIHSFDEETNLYNFIYAQQMQNCVLAQIVDKRNEIKNKGDTGNASIGNAAEQKSEETVMVTGIGGNMNVIGKGQRGKEDNEEKSDGQNMQHNVRRSKRLRSQSRRSDKTEAE